MSMVQPPVRAGYWLAAESSKFPSVSLFSHLIGGSATVSLATYEVEPLPPPLTTFSRTVKKVGDVKTILSIGVYKSGLETFSNMASTGEHRQVFIQSSINLARSYDFDGLDLFWTYPKNQADMENLGTLLVEWREAIRRDAESRHGTRLLLTMAVYFSPNIDPRLTYPICQMKNNLDWVNVIAFDLMDPMRSRDATAAPAPLHNPTGGHCVDGGIKEWLTQLPASQVVLGLPFFGYCWKLVDPDQHGIGAPAEGACDGDSGRKTYAEIKMLLEQGFNQDYDPTYITNYCYPKKTWIGYDGAPHTNNNRITVPGSINMKVRYAAGKDNANEKQLLGYFAFTVGWDSQDRENSPGELAQAAYESWG